MFADEAIRVEYPKSSPPCKPYKHLFVAGFKALGSLGASTASLHVQS
jgi:hypothetical protein